MPGGDGGKAVGEGMARGAPGGEKVARRAGRLGGFRGSSGLVGLVAGFAAYHACFVTCIQLLTELGGADGGLGLSCVFLLPGLLGAAAFLLDGFRPAFVTRLRAGLLALLPPAMLLGLLGAFPGSLLVFAALCGALLGMTHCLYGMAMLRLEGSDALPAMAWVTMASAAAEMAYMALGALGGSVLAWRAAFVLLLLTAGSGALGAPDLVALGSRRALQATAHAARQGGGQQGEAEADGPGARAYARVIGAFIVVSLACRACDVYSLPQFSDLGWMSVALFASHLLAGAALLASSAASREALLYRLALPLVGAGFVLMAAFAQAGLGNVVPVVLVGFGFELMNVFLFVFVLRIAAGSRSPRRLVAGYVAAVYASVLAGKLVSASLSGSAMAVSAVGLVCVVLLVFVAFFILPEREWLPLVGRGGDEAAGMDAVGDFARSHGLTEREEDVLRLLLRGRTLKVIADKLSISASTAGTHIASVYRKTGVHGQQELIDLFEDGGQGRG